WVGRVNRPETASELEALRLSVRRGRPFGEEGWVRRMAKRFGMESTMRPRGRPRGSCERLPTPFILIEWPEMSGAAGLSDSVRSNGIPRPLPCADVFHSDEPENH